MRAFAAVVMFLLAPHSMAEERLVKLFTPPPHQPPQTTEPPLAPATPPRIVEASPRLKEVPVIDSGASLGLSKLHYRWFRIKDYTGPITWEVDNEGIIGLQEYAEAGRLFGAVEGQDDPTFNDITKDAVVVWYKKEGAVKLSALGVVDGKPKRLDSIRLLLGPQPPPVPPGPGPGPAPAPSPLPSTNLKVLMQYERQDKLTKEQTATFSAVVVHDAIKKAGGEWRCWSFADDTSKEAQWWQDAAARPHSGIARVVISSPKGFYDGLPPATPADFITLLGKY